MSSRGATVARALVAPARVALAPGARALALQSLAVTALTPPLTPPPTLTSFLGGMGGNAMIGLSTIACLNGGRERIAPVVTAIGVFLTMAVFHQVLNYIPISALTGVLAITRLRVTRLRVTRLRVRFRVKVPDPNPSPNPSPSPSPNPNQV